MVRTAGLPLLLGRDTPLRHPRSPGSSGSLLRGSLAITTTGLSPVVDSTFKAHQPVVRPPFEAPTPRRRAFWRHRAGPPGSDRFLHQPSAAIRSRNIVRFPTGTGTGLNPLQ